MSRVRAPFRSLPLGALACGLLLLVGGGAPRAARAAGQDKAAPVPKVAPPVTATEALVKEFRADPDGFYFDMRHLEAIACAQKLLADKGAAHADSVNSYRVLGNVYTSLKATAQARAAYVKLFRVDPAAELVPAGGYPVRVTRLFYAVRDSLARGGAGKAAPAAAPGLLTLAIGPIDNRALALPGQKFDYARFSAGLTQMITSDLMPATRLKVVDRQRLRMLLDEIGLAGTGALDKDAAVKAGRLLGAQTFLFGSLTSPGNNLVRLDLRLVQTETGEILLSTSKEKKIGNGNDLLDLERTVVEALAKRLDATLDQKAGGAAVSADAKKALAQRKKSSGDKAMDLVDLTGAAILAEDAGQAGAALDNWRKVLGLSPGNTLAAERVRALETDEKYASLERGK